ncbi:hypothetical protein [Roseimicrobium gellanilyticum]|uniref:hypothetical protein n=1 Tax=Roseimicrobium gellanilyticum TaxID=748857 RepID=UPI0014735219|nr:hypothetical protein [Roseimicrobium gellanilyticum]
MLAALGALAWLGSRWWMKRKNLAPTILLGADVHGLLIRELTPTQDHTRTIPWTDVHAVAAYKIDLFSFDTIALGFQLANGTRLEFCEEVEGWSDLAQGLHHYLPGCIPFHEWFKPVAFPAFQTNFTEIFKRETALQVELHQ